MRKGRSGFTLVELLVVIGIIGVLISILLPTLGKAREAANALKCASNLRSVGQGLAMYVANNKGSLPVSYVYEGMSFGPPQTLAAATSGYLHWTGLIYGKGPNGRGVAAESFTCPNMQRGGLPPTNTSAENLDDGQIPETAGVVDLQAPRTAYTLNEAVCGRNKFTVGFQGAVRTYHWNKAGSIKGSGRTILATEFIDDWRIVSDAARTGGGQKSKSHRPVHGFRATGGAGPAALNMEGLGAAATYERVKYADLTPNCPLNYDSATTKTRLDWVGRNHGRGAYDQKKTNFLYVDGHVETKHIRETLDDRFEWGDVFYSLSPNTGLQ